MPHVLERVFVHGANTCPMCWRGYSSNGRILAPCFGEGIPPWDEYLPLVLERVFVHRTDTCPMFWRGYSSMGRILASQTEHEANEYEYLFVFVSMRGVQSSTLLCLFRIGSLSESVTFWEGEIPSLARPLQSPVFCSTSSCQTINIPLPPLIPISPTATHTVSDSRVPKMVQYHSTPPPRGLSKRLFIYGPTAFLVPVLSEDNCPAELVYETLVQYPQHYYEYTPFMHPIFHLHYPWITLSDIPPPAAKRDAPPLRNECSANSAGCCPDSATTSRSSRSDCSELHTATCFDCR